MPGGLPGHEDDEANRDGRGDRRDPNDWLGKSYQEPSDGRRYVCSRCQIELHLDWCVSVDRAYPEDLKMRPWVCIVHRCPCTGGQRRTRYPWEESALRRLFGGSFTLPFPAGLGSTEDAGEVLDASSPVPYPRTPNEQRLVEWQWEMSQCDSAHDFLLFCRGPWMRDSDALE